MIYLQQVESCKCCKILQESCKTIASRERCAKTNPRAHSRQHPEIWGREQPGGGQTTVSPGVALPACPELDHGDGGEIYQPHSCSWPPEDHRGKRGRQASVGDACQGAPPDIKRQGCRREEAASGRSLGGEAWSPGHMDPPPLPSSLSVGRGPRSAAAKPGCLDQGPGPQHQRTHSHQPPPQQPLFPGLRPHPHPLAVLSLSSHRCREAGRFVGTYCLPSSCGTSGKLVNLFDLGFFSVIFFFFFGGT